MKLLMRMLILIALSLLVCLPALAQDQPVEKFGAFGIGYFAHNSPNIQGWAAMAIPLTTDGKAISYTGFDVAPVKEDSQFSVGGVGIQYKMRTGLAYKMIQIKPNVSLWGMAAPGFQADGNSFMANFQYGGFLHVAAGKGWGAIFLLTAEEAAGVNDFSPRIGITKKF